MIQLFKRRRARKSVQPLVVWIVLDCTDYSGCMEYEIVSVFDAEHTARSFMDERKNGYCQWMEVRPFTVHTHNAPHEGRDFRKGDKPCQD